MTKVKVSGGAIAVAGIGALAVAIYKGWIKLPDVGGWLSGIFGDVGRGAAEGAATGGVPGAIGGLTYNVFAPGSETLGERAQERAPGIAAQEDIPLGIAFHKAVAQEAAADVQTGAFGTGFWGNLFPPFAGYTIGAGLGALEQWDKYLTGLTPEKREVARQEEYTSRAAWMYQHPIESTIGFPAQIIHEITKPEGAPSAPIVAAAHAVKAASPIHNLFFPDTSWKGGMITQAKATEIETKARKYMPFNIPITFPEKYILPEPEPVPVTPRIVEAQQYLSPTTRESISRIAGILKARGGD